MEVIVPLIMMLTFGVISILAMVHDPVVSVPSTKDIMKVLSTLTLVVLIRGEQYVVGRVLPWALVIVEVLTSPHASFLKHWVHHCGGVKHCIEALDLCIYLRVVLRQQGHELIDYDLRGQSIVSRHAVDLLGLPLDLADFIVKHPRPIPELVMACRTLQVELEVVPPGAGTIILPSSMSFADHLIRLLGSPGCSVDLLFGLVGGRVTLTCYEDFSAAVRVGL
jgi:hypothetical protein